MPLLKSSAKAVWTGSVSSGEGRFQVGSNAFPEQTVTLSHRTEDQAGHTNPEELIAAAHATCYAMAFSAALTRNETPPASLDVKAECTLDRIESGLKITRMDLSVSGDVPGLSGAQFEEFARKAEESCPVSNALRGNVEIHLNITAG